MKKIKVIIDCDPGCDDTVALVSALASERLDVLGITSIGGNVDPWKTQRNARGICALVGRADVPVYAGCTHPLQKSSKIDADDVHGESGVHNLILPYDKIVESSLDIDAADFILETTRVHSDDPITLIVIGPMTNIALAFQRDPSVIGRVKEIVTMGGAYGNPGGNISPYAEFNIFSDPLAAKIVYDHFYDIRVLPLDVTHQTLQDESFRVWLRTQGIHGDNLANMLESYAADYPGMKIGNVSPLHDFHTIAAILQPDLYEYKSGNVNVEIDGEREGQTTLVESANGRTKVMLNVNAQKFVQVLRSCLSSACHKN